MKITLGQLKQLIRESVNESLVKEAKQDAYAAEREKLKKDFNPYTSTSSGPKEDDANNEKHEKEEAKAAFELWKKYAPDFTTPNGTVVKDISKIRNFLPKTWSNGTQIDADGLNNILKFLVIKAKSYNEELHNEELHKKQSKPSGAPKPEAPAKPTGMFNRAVAGVKGALGLEEVRQIVREEVARQLRSKH